MVWFNSIALSSNSPMRFNASVSWKNNTTAETAKKPIKKSLAPTPIRREVVRHPSLPDTHLGALPPTGMMRNLHKLSVEDRAIVQEMSECIAPIHKSNLIYVTAGMNPASLGRKNEVL